MEAASRPAFEPLADLPVEEPFGLNGTASQPGSGRPSSSAAVPATTAASPPSAPSMGPMDSGEDLLAHGVLLDLGPEAPPASSVSTSPPLSTPPLGAPSDSGLIPTLLASAEL